MYTIGFRHCVLDMAVTALIAGHGSRIFLPFQSYMDRIGSHKNSIVTSNKKWKISSKAKFLKLLCYLTVINTVCLYCSFYIHCIWRAGENPIQRGLTPIYVLPEMKLCSLLLIFKTELFLSPDSYLLHISVRDLTISRIGLSTAKYLDRSWEYVNRSQAHECGY